MHLTAESKKSILRRAVFAVLILLAASLQNTGGLFPEIFGVRAMLLIPAVVCISMHEREIPGIFYGLFAGLLWDAYSAHPGNINALLLTAAGFVCGALINYSMRNNIVTAALLTAAAALVHNTAAWLFSCVIPGFDGAGRLYLTFYLPSCLYTLAVMPAFYFLTRLIINKSREQ